MANVFELDAHLPEPLRGKYKPERIHLLKVGHVGLELTEVPKATEGAEVATYIHRFSSALHDSFKASEYVEDLRATDSASGQRGASLVLGNLRRLALSDPLELSVKVPKHRQSIPIST